MTAEVGETPASPGRKRACRGAALARVELVLSDSVGPCSAHAHSAAEAALRGSVELPAPDGQGSGWLPAAGRGEGAELALNAIEQLVVGVAERPHALALELER